MKQLFKKLSLFMLGGLLFSNAAWADTTIGNIDEGWGSHKVDFTLPANKTLSLNFVVNSTKNTENYQGWVTQVLHGSDMIFFMQPSCGYAVGSWDWGNNTHKYNENNYVWDGTSFRDNLQGATVSYSLKRINSEIILTEDVTTSDNSKHFRHYFVYKDDYAAEELTVALAADFASLTITDVTEANVISNSEAPVLTGTLIGTLNNAKGGIKDQDFVTFPLKANASLSLHFKNYTNKLQIWNNFVVEITDGTHFLDLRGDGGGWQWAENWGEYTPWWNESNLTKTGYPANNYEYMEAMDGADVVISISRASGAFNIEATITPVSGSAFSESYTFTDNNLADNEVYVNLLCEGGHLDLLPVIANIGTYEWATFCSDYALDFSKATDGLNAYMITGHSGNAVTLDKVTGTVPAGTPLLINGAEGSYSIPIVGSSSTDVSGNLLQRGTGTVSKADGYTRYVLSVNGGVAEFQKIVGTPATVGTDKAYLEFAGDVTAPVLMLEFSSETTGISEVRGTQNMASGTIFNISGQRVSKASKGLYIVNGKKVAIK